MNRALRMTVFALLGAATTATAQEAPEKAEIRTLPDLIAAMEAREGALESVSLGMETTGVFPGGVTFRTEGTVRVLGTTHIHSSMKMTYGTMESEVETVLTPDGVQMRERDPAQGEVFVRIEKALLDQLESASAALGDGGDPGFVPPGRDQAAGPLGSVMLADLDKQFALELAGPKLVDGAEAYVVSGDRREDAPDAAEDFGAGDRVEVVVRRADLALVRMTQFAQGKTMIEIKLTALQLDAPMDRRRSC